MRLEHVSVEFSFPASAALCQPRAMTARLSPFSTLTSAASDLERQYAEQSKKIVQLAKAGQFKDMPAEQQRLEQLIVALRAERQAAKRTKATT